MSKDNPIEEMAIAVCPLIEEYGSCEKCNSEIDIDDKKCIYQTMAELFINAGYRKASEVVRKMHSEIKERCIKGGTYPAFVERTIDQIAKEMLEEG